MPARRTALDRLAAAALSSHYNPDNNPWDPPLRSYFPAPPSRSVRGPMQDTLVPDGPPRHPVLGGGRPQHPLMKHVQRRARRS